MLDLSSITKLRSQILASTNHSINKVNQKNSSIILSIVSDQPVTVALDNGNTISIISYSSITTVN